MRRIFVFLPFVLIATGCGGSKPVIKPAPTPNQQAVSPTQSLPNSTPPNPAPGAGTVSSAPGQSLFPSPTPAFGPQFPATTPGIPDAAPAVPQPAVNSTFRLAEQKVLASIDISPGNTIRGKEGERIVWVRFDVNHPSPLTANLS